MAAGKHGSSEVTITIDDSGGTPRTMTNFVLTMGALKITSNMQKSDAYGDSWEESLPSGIQKVDPIKFTGFFDDTATTGPHVVMGNPDATPTATTRTIAIVIGNAKTFTVEAYLQAYAVIGKQGLLTEFEADYQPTGSAVWS